MKRELDILNRSGLEITEKQLSLFETYYKRLIEWNEKINLTAVTDKEEVYTKHFLDSLEMTRVIDISDQTMLDIGSGAGFPGIPLKILFPEIKLTIIDALRKRIDFLRLLTDELGIEVELIHGRAEEHDRKNAYDLVTARAVASLNILSELCLPFVRIGGYFVAYKGSNYNEELKRSANSFRILRSEVERIETFTLIKEKRALIAVKKIEETPDGYPRKFKKIKSRPL